MSCADDLGPVIPRTFPPPLGWSPDGHRIKAPLEEGRGSEKTWVWGALRPGDGQAVTLTAPSRDSAGDQQLLAAVELANPTGELAVITDNLSSHSSIATWTWLVEHPRIRQVFLPKGACWLHLQEAWWRLFRRAALAGQSFANPKQVALATEVATGQLNARARPGCGAVYHRRHATADESSPTAFEERSASRTLSGRWLMGRVWGLVLPVHAQGSRLWVASHPPNWE